MSQIMHMDVGSCIKIHGGEMTKFLVEMSWHHNSPVCAFKDGHIFPQKNSRIVTSSLYDS